eukprot:175657-Prymnesium_polylepis.1
MRCSITALEPNLRRAQGRRGERNHAEPACICFMWLSSWTLPPECNESSPYMREHYPPPFRSRCPLIL